MAKHNTLKFYFGVVLATVTSFLVVATPYALLWEFFRPIGFFQKAVFFFLTAGGVVPLGMLAFFVWVLIASQFE